MIYLRRDFFSLAGYRSAAEELSDLFYRTQITMRRHPPMPDKSGWQGNGCWFGSMEAIQHFGQLETPLAIPGFLHPQVRDSTARVKFDIRRDSYTGIQGTPWGKTMETTGSTEQRIKEALRRMEEEARLPMNAGQLVEELMRQTNLARSTVYRYQRQWRKFARPPRTTLDEDLEKATDRQRFLISIRMPADLLRWLKAEGEARNMGYQSLIVSLLYWSKDNPLMSGQSWMGEDEGEDEED
jgi:uncharacterized protein (DUF4415 family)